MCDRVIECGWCASVSTRKTARAGKYCICAHIQASHALHVTLACTRSHPHPLKGLRRAQQHNARKLCAAHGRVLVGSVARIICAMCACPRLLSLQPMCRCTSMCSGIVLPPPTRCVACSRTQHPAAPRGSLFFILAALLVVRTRCVLTKSGVRCCLQRLAPCSPRQGLRK